MGVRAPLWRRARSRRRREPSFCRWGTPPLCRNGARLASRGVGSTRGQIDWLCHAERERGACARAFGLFPRGCPLSVCDRAKSSDLGEDSTGERAAASDDEAACVCVSCFGADACPLSRPPVPPAVPPNAAAADDADRVDRADRFGKKRVHAPSLATTQHTHNYSSPARLAITHTQVHTHANGNPRRPTDAASLLLNPSSSSPARRRRDAGHQSIPHGYVRRHRSLVAPARAVTSARQRTLHAPQAHQLKAHPPLLPSLFPSPQTPPINHHHRKGRRPGDRARVAAPPLRRRGPRGQGGAAGQRLARG